MVSIVKYEKVFYFVRLKDEENVGSEDYTSDISEHKEPFDTLDLNLKDGEGENANGE